MVFPVTVVRGLATYNVRKQKDFEVTGNFIAGMTYSLPVYDVDPESGYYVAMPDVNLYSGELASGGTDDSGNDEDTIYVSCLDYKPDDGYIVLAFTTSGQQGYTHMQEAVAVYKFKVEPKYPVRLKKVSSLTAMTSDNAVYADLSGAKYGIYESKANAEEGKDGNGGTDSN